MTEETAKITLKKLETDFGGNNYSDNHAAFKNDYKQYLQDNFPEFTKHHSADAISGGGTIPATNPMLGGENFHLTTTTAKEGEAILEKGKAAQEVFGKMSIDDRLDFLKILQEKIKNYSEDIKLTITADMGKPVDLTAGELDKGNAWFKFAEKEAKKQLEPKYAQNSNMGRAGLGVVQVIGAFNYPYALTIPGIVGGLAAGNSVVVSTPEKAPNFIFPLMQAAGEAVAEFTDKRKDSLTKEEVQALKSGLMQYSIGRDPTISNSADLVHFVGSNETGEKIRKARGNKPTILEMGGSNVVMVMNSAIHDHETTPEKAIDKISKEIYAGFAPATGQRCTAPQFLLMHDGDALKVGEALKEMCQHGPAIGKDGIGNSFSKGTKIGPLVDERAYNDTKEIIGLAQSDEYKGLGIKVHGNFDANKGNLPLPKGGRWVNPVVIDLSKAEKDHPKTQEFINKIKGKEFFAPVLFLLPPIANIHEGVEIAKDIDPHHLASAIYTDNKDKYKDKEIFFTETSAVSKAHNKAPKDESPDKPHGHPGGLQIGGSEHFKNYSKLVKLDRSLDGDRDLVGAGVTGYRR
ncbi:MAG: aldehyde dehydrogenase [Rickettsiales bacterium]